MRRDAQSNASPYPPPRGCAAATSALLQNPRRQTPGSSPAHHARPRRRAPPWRIPARFGARSPPPGLQGSGPASAPPDSGATSLKAAPRSSRGAGREGAGPGAGRSRIPEHAQCPLPGTRVQGADSAGGPHPLPRLLLRAGGDAPRSRRPLLRLLDLARVLKAGPRGTRGSGLRVSLPPVVRSERLPPSTSLAASSAAGVAKECDGSGL